MDVSDLRIQRCSLGIAYSTWDTSIHEDNSEHMKQSLSRSTTVHLLHNMWNIVRHIGNAVRAEWDLSATSWLGPSSRQIIPEWPCASPYFYRISLVAWFASTVHGLQTCSTLPLWNEPSCLFSPATKRGSSMFELRSPIFYRWRRQLFKSTRPFSGIYHMPAIYTW